MNNTDKWILEVLHRKSDGLLDELPEDLITDIRIFLTTEMKEDQISEEDIWNEFLYRAQNAIITYYSI